jgi:hypothetical protein
MPPQIICAQRPTDIRILPQGILSFIGTGRGAAVEIARVAVVVNQFNSLTIKRGGHRKLSLATITASALLAAAFVSALCRSRRAVYILPTRKWTTLHSYHVNHRPSQTFSSSLDSPGPLDLNNMAKASHAVTAPRRSKKRARVAPTTTAATATALRRGRSAAIKVSPVAEPPSSPSQQGLNDRSSLDTADPLARRADQVWLEAWIRHGSSCVNPGNAVSKGKRKRGMPADTPVNFHSFSEAEAIAIRRALIQWYESHRRKLPWRGDSPPIN